jgi:hypothetical protein
MNNREFELLLKDLYPTDRWPKPLHLLQGAAYVDSGQDVTAAARAVGTSRAQLERVAAAKDRVGEALGAALRDVDARHRRRAAQVLGQLVVGRAAEMAFEDIYRTEMHSQELELRDLRESRSDTDYRLFNGGGRPIYLINIKFHGSLFRRAPELVGLEPEDCFALATYKIHGSLKKQDVEGLPYIFAIVGVRSLSGEQVGADLPSQFVDALAFLYHAPRAAAKRDIEDRMVNLLAERKVAVYRDTFEAVRAADWYVLSARRADRLVRELLYERVFAMRVPRFAQQFRSAELDMHFSLKRDLTPLRSFLATLRDEGHPKVVTLLERGAI